MKIITCEQNSEEWYAARLGKATASCFSKVLAKGQGKTRKSYMLQLAAERLTDEPQDSFSNAAMERGTVVEPQARAAYEAIYGAEVKQVGFCVLNDDVGCSPDGLVGDDGLIEIKCPNSTTHIETILADKAPSKYEAQIQGCLWVTGRQWCDFVSFDPRVKSNRIKRIRVMRDQKYIDNLAKEIDLFIIELASLVEKVDVCPF